MMFSAGAQRNGTILAQRMSKASPICWVPAHQSRACEHVHLLGQPLSSL
jgi:hypothetical protein